MNTADFKTKSLIKDWKMPKINGNNQFLNRVIVGIDGGYSSVKAITNSKIALFPSYAKKIDKKSFNIVAQLDDTTIIMTDNIRNETWVVGEMAETLIDDIDVSNTTDASLYSRYHLQNPIYIATMTAGLAICLMDMDLTNTQVYVQTGLPCEYLDDADELKDVLTGHYDVTMKIGNNEEKRVIFDLKKDAINVIEQPKGTMISAVYDNHGQPLADRIGILKQNTLIVDIGFGTEDLFSIKSSVNNKQNTYSDTAMKSVFENTIKDINDEKHTNFKIFEFQKYLEDGVIPIFIRGKGNIRPHIEPYDFTELLNKNNKELCEKSINRILYEYDNLIKYNYLIVTGGTGESRFDMIEDALSGLTVTVIKGNENAPDLPFVFSNVRGYYMSAYLRLLNQG